jgi:hypothetical protein
MYSVVTAVASDNSEIESGMNLITFGLCSVTFNKDVYTSANKILENKKKKLIRLIKKKF